MKNRILIVEDQEEIRLTTGAFLKEQGYEILYAEDGEKAIEIYHEADLLLLDIMLPKISGLDVLKTIRETSNVPIIMLTAVADEGSQLYSFNKLADDYVCKPFSLVLLLKRIEALLRRKGKNINFFTFGEARIDFKGYRAYLGKEEISVTPREFQVLKFLIDNKNIVKTREEILDSLYIDGEEPFDRVIDVYIKNIRKKLKLTCIKTKKGVGYVYEEY